MIALSFIVIFRISNSPSLKSDTHVYLNVCDRVETTLLNDEISLFVLPFSGINYRSVTGFCQLISENPRIPILSKRLLKPPM